ncbi:hypothetical protein ACG33_12925 [Steroidobacter denitrificans]|uniref:Uncharacterized protein n=1 Tax=Steroidobacter denitrificans TaxID=465721 RepID=A0A127FC42_STEDE|nr:hypothetical protein ACG33_12925 [Steroidobacter denitrificans]
MFIFLGNISLYITIGLAMDRPVDGLVAYACLFRPQGVVKSFLKALSGNFQNAQSRTRNISLYITIDVI